MSKDLFTTEHVEVTPERARELLSLNTKNRSVSQRHVERLAADMEEGRWRDHAHARLIEIAEGRIVDGQHRLLAIIKADVTIPLTLVTYHEEVDADDIQLVVDTGTNKRSVAAQLRLNDVPSANSMAALARAVVADEAGMDMKKPSRWPVSDQEVIACALNRTDELLDAIHTGDRLRRTMPVVLSSASWFAWKVAVLAEDQPDMQEDFEEFQRRLRDLDFGGALDPLANLYKRVHKIADDPRRGGAHTRVEMMALLVKAWNAYRLGEDVKVLSWRPGGSAPEAFPEML